MHLTDVASFEPLALLVLVPIFRMPAARGRAVRAATAVIGGQILVYAPFYFDGNYPGGGARFFADVLQIEHALLAFALALLLPRFDLASKGMAALAVACAGFAVHAVFGHVALAERDGGRPMFEQDVLRRASFTHGLLFVETDHAFNLAYDPDAARDPGPGRIVVARLKND